MNILITAGGTLVPIDRVRGLGNSATGVTGAMIALAAHDRGHYVTLATSRPQSKHPQFPLTHVRKYETFDQLHEIMTEAVPSGRYDCIVHSAAVSDYRPAGIFAPATGTKFEDGGWHGDPPALEDRSAGKISSDDPELWLRLVRTPKLIDLVRTKWQFRGVLVKFKLEVGLDAATLTDIAERSRKQSDADLMVANTVEGARSWALLGPFGGYYERMTRHELPTKLVFALEDLFKERGHG
jgi:phosphopantothenoylcysteine synthetase/decarboxylase